MLAVFVMFTLLLYSMTVGLTIVMDPALYKSSSNNTSRNRYKHGDLAFYDFEDQQDVRHLLQYATPKKRKRKGSVANKKPIALFSGTKTSKMIKENHLATSHTEKVLEKASSESKVTKEITVHESVHLYETYHFVSPSQGSHSEYVNKTYSIENNVATERINSACKTVFTRVKRNFDKKFSEGIQEHTMVEAINSTSVTPSEIHGIGGLIYFRHVHKTGGSTFRHIIHSFTDWTHR